MILTKMTAVGTDGNRVMLWFDDGTRMKVPAGVVIDHGLFQGMELDEDTLAQLLDGAQKASARDRAVRIVSAASISEKELKRRLVQRGERPEDAGEAVEWLRDIGAVDDGAMARHIVRRCVDKGYGEVRIRQELYARGIPKRYWEEALENLPDMAKTIDRFLMQRLRGAEPDQRELKRVTDALLRRGHSWEDIGAALRRYQEALDQDAFD